MSKRLPHLEESQRKMRTSMGLENPVPTVYPALPPPVVEDPWAWYRNKDNDGDDEDDDEADDKEQEESE
jgi:hypothetical protein